jgi:serine/threonine protein kinase
MAERFDTLPSPGQLDSPNEPAEQKCLKIDEILALAQGQLSDAGLEDAHAHMDCCGICQRLLNEAAHALTTLPMAMPEEGDWNTTFQPDALVGQRYRVVRFIARGGMGEVYEAYDCELQERVALKTVASVASDSPRAVRRLKAEVQMARRVSHPNVCRIYDLGMHILESTGASIHFLTMEFVEGETLGDWIRLHGALPADQAESVVRQLLAGLSAAHHAGVLHRDFKSDNVMLRKEANDQIAAVILDFGLARWLDGDGVRHTSGRNLGLVGTLSYMAPEQVEGKALSTASDLYAFGVVWFEMLTGKLPFGAHSAAASALERLHKPACSPSSVNPAVPRTLDTLVLRCLSRVPEERYQSAEDLLLALDGLLAPSAARVGSKSLIRVGLAAAVSALTAAALVAYRPHVSASKLEVAPPSSRALELVTVPRARPEPVSVAPSQAVPPPTAAETPRKATMPPRQIHAPPGAQRGSTPSPVRTTPAGNARLASSTAVPGATAALRPVPGAQVGPKPGEAGSSRSVLVMPATSATRSQPKPDWVNPFADAGVPSRPLPRSP